ncbi:hypothetical protein NBRC116596_17900 [Litorivita sp. NS0012-18]
MMTHIFTPLRQGALRAAMVLGLALGLALPIAPAARAADCYADYKAKQDAPLKLHYGVLALNGACTKSDATEEAAKRLKQNGWTLLQVLSVFDATQLDQRKTNAGPYYLRF